MKTLFVSIVFVLLSSLSLPAQNNNANIINWIDYQHSFVFEYNRVYRHSGFFGNIDLQHGFLFACSSSLGSHTSFDAFRFIGGYFVNPRLSVGVGFGIEGMYGIPTPENTLTVPVLADVKGYLYKKPRTPFAFVTVGIPLHFAGSFQIEPGVGYETPLVKLFVMHVTLSYKLQYYNNITFYRSCFSDNVERSLPITFHFMSLGLGFSF